MDFEDTNQSWNLEFKEYLSLYGKVYLVQNLVKFVGN
jgi:hypothetical protein